MIIKLSLDKKISFYFSIKMSKFLIQLQLNYVICRFAFSHTKHKQKAINASKVYNNILFVPTVLLRNPNKNASADYKTIKFKPTTLTETNLLRSRQIHANTKIFARIYKQISRDTFTNAKTRYIHQAKCTQADKYFKISIRCP